ncbi:MAG TPA: NAD-dependent epimerase/dehydratase family protein [bacterium]|nr:NAD-dependent epimerase/dehydratase family protein [bacterium]
MEKVLVTGASGFIGSHLVEFLLQKRYAVRCLVRKTSDLRWISDLNAEIVYGDFGDRESLSEALKDIGLLFHLAGTTKALNREAFYQGNVAGTRALLEIIEEKKIPLRRFVFVSSQAVVGPARDERPVTEETPPRPLTRYGNSKLEAENLVRSYASRIPVTIIRSPGVFGPRDPDVFEAFRWVGRGLQPVLGWKERYVSFIYVEDLVRGLVMAAESSAAEGKLYHMVTEPDLTWKSFTQVISAIMGKKGIRFHVPLTLFAAVCLIRDGIAIVTRKPGVLNWDKTKEFYQRFWLFDGSRAEAELGFRKEFDFHAAVEKTYHWYLDSGWLSH